MMGAVTGGLGLVAVLAAGFGYWQYEEAQAEREARVEWQMTAIERKAVIDDLRARQKMAQKQADKLAQVRSDFQRETQELVNEIQSQRAAREAERIEQPYTAGNDDWIALSRIMCRIANQGRSDPRSCDFSSEDASTAVSPVVTVTPDTAERWEELCNNGRQDFCRWSLTGLTTDGIAQLKTWMAQIERYTEELRASLRYYRRAIEKQSASPGSSEN